MHLALLACIAVQALRSAAPLRSAWALRSAAPRSCCAAMGLGSSAGSLFGGALDALSESEAQKWLMRDIGRRRRELVALGWLARAYRCFPWALERMSLFRLEGYQEDTDMATLWHIRADGCVECTVRESSVVARGVPLRLQLRFAHDGLTLQAAELTAVGCDLNPTHAAVAEPMRAADAVELANALRPVGAKVLVAEAIVRAVFELLEPSLERAASSGPLVACTSDSTRSFSPRRDLFAREGTSEKWLQKITDYYFAESRLVDLCFENDKTLRFSFYYDSTEPPNSADPFRNVNPEVLCCKFDSYFR
mmetsp:Transcript_14616/g.37087  ORF Transcript_14616/g.37087 Transcript_14616/m.37087 type:complete len:307 (+) Transcript_14616:875-1795(+)